MRGSCSLGQEIQRMMLARELGVLFGTRWWQHRWTLRACESLQTWFLCWLLNKRKMVSILNSKSLQIQGCGTSSSKISWTKCIQFIGTESNILSFFHKMYLVMSLQTTKVVRTHAGAHILMICTQAYVSRNLTSARKISLFNNKQTMLFLLHWNLLGISRYFKKIPIHKNMICA